MHRQTYPTLTFESHPPPPASSTVNAVVSVGQPTQHVGSVSHQSVTPQEFTFTYPSHIAFPGIPSDHTQPQLLSPAPSSPLSVLESATADELDNAPEFYQYSKEKYESSKMGGKRRRRGVSASAGSSARSAVARVDDVDVSSMDGADDGEDANSTLSHAEFRRQIHIQSEQKRRAEIKDGFEELRRHLPYSYAGVGRKLSKASILQRTVHHLKQTRSKEAFLLDEINKLHQTVAYLHVELDKEKRLNDIYRQKQTLEKIYSIGL